MGRGDEITSLSRSAWSTLWTALECVRGEEKYLQPAPRGKARWKSMLLLSCSAMIDMPDTLLQITCTLAPSRIQGRGSHAKALFSAGASGLIGGASEHRTDTNTTRPARIGDAPTAGGRVKPSRWLCVLTHLRLIRIVDLLSHAEEDRCVGLRHFGPVRSP
ncbi:hypothetical protein AXG93_115s1830 [Marchantia polymorpha subsp. ruderalis]|uniref:Uncharacterized protein n=1 Tax=Marchantia polymorpha subsp. ruderalis TaxID=1480154 RepID=A0A176W7P4_MARPO|nr:hypothetical protein AXG93_115s1830 [Marchantia polymorpha subsp. ruderalis]